MIPVILGAVFTILEKVFEKVSEKSSKVQCSCLKLKKKCQHKKAKKKE